jgi:probable F420-dependent oxidoreductase
MKLDAMIGGVGLRRSRDFAHGVEDAGFDALWFTEGGRTAYLSCAAAGIDTERIGVGTAVALAFPRSPFVTASTAWELADVTDGRFVLGLGTQVRGHIERRYSAPFSPPGPRLREYVLAVRAVWRAFETGEPLLFEGRYWPMTIGTLSDAWSGGTIAHPDIPVFLAGVRPWMLRMIGSIGDGLHVHPLHSARYVEEVIRPAIEAGATAAGRDPQEIQLACPVLTIVGDTERERGKWRERARFQLAFYGSTRSYGGVFDLHGWAGLADALYERQRAGDIQGMSRLITDDMLDVYALTGRWDELPGMLMSRYQGLADRLVMYFSGSAWREDPDVLSRWSDVAAAVHASTSR